MSEVERSISQMCDLVASLRDENDRLRTALDNFMEITRPASIEAFRDPQHGDEVEALGERIGYGALMSTASASWRDAQIRRYGQSLGGEFVVGPCMSVLISAREKARTALEGKPSRHVGTSVDDRKELELKYGLREEDLP